MAKWNANDIIHFLEIYETYSVLWNIRHEDYLNKNLKYTVFNQLVEELKGERLELPAEKLKAKIKSLKDVYRQELAKIEKSKKNGSRAGNIYKPKLLWFDKAAFLHKVVSTGQTKSKPNLSSETAVEDRGQTEFDEIDVSEESQSLCKYKRKNRLSSKQSNKKSTTLKSAFPNLDPFARKVNTEDAYDQFGKYVASQIRGLPPREAVLLQQEIHNSMTHALLSCMPSPSPLASTRSTLLWDSKSGSVSDVIGVLDHYATAASPPPSYYTASPNADDNYTMQ